MRARASSVRVAMRSRRWRAVTVGIVVVLCGIGYAVFGSSTQINRSDMSRLVVQTVKLPKVNPKPYLSEAQSAASVPTKVLSQEMAKDPASAGAYTIGWQSHSATSYANLLVELLPTRSSAKAARNSLQEQYAKKKDYSQLGLTLVGSLSIPQVPGVFASEFTVSATSKGAAPTALDVVAFQVKRVAALIVVQGSTSAGIKSGTTGLAVSEEQLLQREEPRFSMSQTAYRALRALWFGLGALVVSLLVIFSPVGVRLLEDRRTQQTLRARRQEDRHVSARGSKVLKGRKPPAWQTARPRSRSRRKRLGSRN